MAKARWKGGRDMHHLQLQVRKRGADLKANALEALEVSIQEGGEYTQDYLYAATTKTGEERVASSRGQFAGRHETGNMIGSVSNEIRNRLGSIVWGVFGWWGVNFEQYMRDQDLGEGDIPAARALPQAQLRARENFRRRMRDVVRGRPVS